MVSRLARNAAAFSLTSFTNEQDSVSAVKANAFDVILCAASLNTASGETAISRLREAECVGNVISLVSARAPEQLQAMDRAGSIGMLEKLFDQRPAQHHRPLRPAPSSRQSIRRNGRSQGCWTGEDALASPAGKMVVHRLPCHGPKRSGKSRQGAPVARIQKIPLRSVRRSRAGRPVLAVLPGTSESTNAHCSSVSSWRFMIGDLHVVKTDYPVTAFSDAT